MMTYLITPGDLAAFRRCHRQWDLGARERRNLEAADPRPAAGLGEPIREALDIYYFPGMWDWERRVTAPLVVQGFERALARQRPRCGGPDETAWQQRLEAGRGLLGRYFAWSPAADRFSPVLVQADYEVHVLDPERPPHGLVTAAGQAVRYRGKIDMLAVDAHDAYWIVAHRVVEADWPPTQALVEDEELITACWAWEQFYLGMTIAGTIHNELRLDPVGGPVPAVAAGRGRGLRRGQGGQQQRVRQHEPSGGGRSIPQHRRMYAAAREPRGLERIEQQSAAGFRRTWVRRSRAEVAQAGRRLAAAAAQMTAAGVTAEPSPSPAYCPDCAFLRPCQAMQAGRGADAEGQLRAGYRVRAPDTLAEGRLGGRAWGMGRGGAPPRFGS